MCYKRQIFKKEKELSKKIISTLKVTEVSDVNCLSCGNATNNVIFKINGMNYYICENCWSISLDTKSVTDKEIHAYHFNSELSAFRKSDNFQKSACINRATLWANLIEWIEWRITRYKGVSLNNITLIENKYNDFISLLEESNIVNQIKLIHSLTDVDEISSFNEADVCCSIDSLQRQRQPQKFLQEVHRELKDEGLFLLTTRVGTGIDILTLGDNNESIYPLDHIFLPSPKAIEQLLEENGFEVLEITTPGMLDFKILEESEIPQQQYFQRYIIEQGSNKLNENFQSFLQRNNLSSYVRVIAKKKGK
jgi:SAM-dependent methyltransferase